MKNQIVLLAFIVIIVILCGAYYPRVGLGVYAEMVVPDTTLHALADTYIPVDASFTNTFYGGFQFVADPAIEYIHDGRHRFMIMISGSMSHSLPNTKIYINVKVNGVLKTAKPVFAKTANEPVPFTYILDLYLEEDDKIQLVWAVETAGTTVTEYYVADISRAD